MNRLRYILQHRYLLKILAIITLALCLLYTKTVKRESKYLNETVFIGHIYRIKVSDSKATIYLKAKENLLINYYAELPKNIKIGDIVKIEGNLEKPSNNTIPNLFNYQKYLYYNDIFNIINANKITKISNNTTLLYYIKDIISKRIDKLDKTSKYLRIFIIGDNTQLDKNIIESYRENGISHLFAISGMHISLFASFLFFFLKRISYNNYYNYGLVIIFLIFYSLLIGSTPSVIRSITMYILIAINKLLNLKVKKIDLMCLVLTIIISFKPFYIYNTSFQYSYITSFLIIMFSYKTRKIKSTILKTIYISFVAFVASFPLCIRNYFQVNFLSIILNIIFVPLISIIIFPLTLITFLFPIFNNLLTPLIKIMETISLFISKYNLGTITFSKPSVFFIIVYYLLTYLFLHNSKYIYILFIMLCYKYIPYLNTNTEVTFLDVNQGDSIFIKYPLINKNILIDSGGNIDSNYHIAINRTIPYFKSMGINKINYLVFTHGDYDHMGEAINLVENFKVEKVIFNCGPYNDLEKELIKVLDRKKIKYYSCIKELNIDNNKLYFLQTKEYDNENDNSNVIYTELDGYKFMFMGDAGVEKEKDILDKYNISNVDVLKVGHHGSKTSSSKNFINEIEPKYSIISVGKNNRYGHPNKEVLNNLEDSTVYRTDQDGSIMFKIKNKKLQVETCSP